MSWADAMSELLSWGTAGIEAGERATQAALQDDVAEAVALGVRRVRRDVGSTGDGVAQLAEPVEGGVFDDGFREARHGL